MALTAAPTVTEAPNNQDDATEVPPMQTLRDTRPLYPVFAILFANLAAAFTERPLVLVPLVALALAMVLPWWLAGRRLPAPR